MGQEMDEELYLELQVLMQVIDKTIAKLREEKRSGWYSVYLAMFFARVELGKPILNYLQNKVKKMEKNMT